MTDGILFAMIGVTKAKALNPSGCGAFFYLQKGGFIMSNKKSKLGVISAVAAGTGTANQADDLSGTDDPTPQGH